MCIARCAHSACTELKVYCAPSKHNNGRVPIPKHNRCVVHRWSRVRNRGRYAYGRDMATRKNGKRTTHDVHAIFSLTIRQTQQHSSSQFGGTADSVRSTLPNFEMIGVRSQASGVSTIILLTIICTVAHGRCRHFVCPQHNSTTAPRLRHTCITHSIYNARAQPHHSVTDANTNKTRHAESVHRLPLGSFNTCKVCGGGTVSALLYVK